MQNHSLKFVNSANFMLIWIRTVRSTKEDGWQSIIIAKPIIKGLPQLWKQRVQIAFSGVLLRLIKFDILICNQIVTVRVTIRSKTLKKENPGPVAIGGKRTLLMPRLTDFRTIMAW